MEAIAATADPTLERPPVKLLREPLFWASAAAFVGVAVGLAATFLVCRLDGCLAGTWGPRGALAARRPRYILAVLSLLGVPALLGRGSRALRIGTALLLVWLPVELAVRLSPKLYPSLWSPKGLPSPVLTLASVATDLLGSAAVLSLGLGAFFSGARRLEAVLLILGVPAGSLFFGAHYALTGTDAISNQLAVTTTVLFGAPLRVAEACLFTLLGAMLLGCARGRGLAKAELSLGKNDPSVVEEVVSSHFRDPRGGVRGKGGMGGPSSRIFGPATPIWRSQWRARRRRAT